MDKMKIGILALVAVITKPCFSGAMGPVSITIDNWTGVYLGGQIGEAWGYQDLRKETATSTRIGYARNNNTSFIGGGYLGFNWQINDFLVGAEADANGLNLSNYSTCLYQNDGVNNPSPGSCFPQGYNYDIQIPWEAAARGRLGWIWRNALFYVAGGVAFAEVKSTFTTAVNYLPLGSESFSNIYTGSTAAIGGEYKFNCHWIARAEYRYSNFGINRRVITEGGGFWNQYTVEEYIKDNSFRVGLSYLI